MSNRQPSILVLDRHSVLQAITEYQRCIVISIRDPEKPRIRIPKNSTCTAILYVAFHDTEPADWPAVPPDVKIFSLRQAKRIWKFVETHVEQADAIVVHCEFGKSRSPAVAAAICEFLGRKANDYFEQYVPNDHVYQVMVRSKPPTRTKT